MKEKRLFEEFPPITTKEWIDKLRDDLKGADPIEKLVWKTGEGFDLMPFYRREDLEKLNHIGFILPLYLRGDVRQPADRGVQTTSERGDVRQPADRGVQTTSEIGDVRQPTDRGVQITSEIGDVRQPADRGVQTTSEIGDVRQPTDRGVQTTSERGDIAAPGYSIADHPGQENASITEKNSNSWLIRQDIQVGDCHAANRKAVSILMKGVDSVGFILTDADTVNEENLKILLSGIDPECAEINFHPEGKAIEIIKSISGIWRNNGYNLSLIKGAVEADPLIRLVINGKLCIPVDSGFDYLASLIRETLILENYRCIHINGKWFKNSGSGSVCELAFALSMAVEYMSQMTERGLDPGSVAKSIRFSFGIGPSYFIEIARLRAARLLWAAVCRKFGVSGKSSRMEIHCETVTNNQDSGDPYMNMIRTQTEAMSAVIGGTDSLTIHPYRGINDKPEDFAERIARNQQLLLKEEALFDKVADPSAGSYYIETITSLIAENAWKLFLQIEENGGFLKAFSSGLIHSLMSGQEKNGANAG